MARQSVIWGGVALFSFALIIYYIYFLDVNECIVESDGSEEYLESRQDRNKHLFNKNTSTKNNNTIFECPQINLTSLCTNFCNYTGITSNITNNLQVNNSNIVANNNIVTNTNANTNTNTTTPCVNITYVINSNFSSNNSNTFNNSCSGGVGYVVPGVAVLIEPRSLLGIKNVTMNMMENLPKHWKIQIFTSTNNTKFAQVLLKKYLDSGKVIIDDSILGNTTSLKREDFNNILVSESFWNKIIAEKVLVFQVDSMICKDSQRDIASFLQYDFIGAPWRNDTTWGQLSYYIGNGGFSLRSRSKSLEVIKRYPRHGLNEDGYFARAMAEIGASMPTYAEAMQFAVERIFYPTPFGVHRFGYKRFTPDQQAQLLEYCPELNSRDDSLYE